MKASAVFVAMHAVLCLASLSAAAAMLWVAAELRKGRFRWKVPGIERLSPTARLSFARYRAAVLLLAAIWLIAGALGILRLGLVISAWSAVLSVAAAIVLCGYAFAARKHGVKRA